MALVSEFSQPDKVASFWDPPSSNAASLGSVPAAMAAAVLSTIEVLICIIIVTFRTVIVIRDTLDARKVKGNYELVGMEVV
ncbi:hypothetical protein GQ53DRAFT_746095 [Thozetella sp. PMI_491]|nr:hypothetical protein GQ53DRAFT_746095 [Thozetella sp. PMI_491]